MRRIECARMNEVDKNFKENQMKKIVLTASIAAFMISGCVSNGGGLSANQSAAIGTAVGALAGGVLGHQLNDDNGRYVGAAAGALAGAAIGNYMDRQQQQLQQQVQGTGINVQRIDQGTLQLNIPGDVLFATDEYQIRPNFYQTLNSVAQTMNQYPQTIVHIYGHTDSTGRAAYNQGLSERRANSAAQYLMQQGVNMQRILSKGYGQNYPRANNATPDGRAQNRRVEVYIKAIDQNNPQAAYQSVY